jgi:hypothetical protein
MSLTTELKLALQGLTLASNRAQSLTCFSDGQHLQIELAALDCLACSFTQLTVTTPKLVGASAKVLKSTAEALSKRLTYLLEPISPIETDSEGCTVQMRSMPPQKEENVTSYYELLVSRDGRLSLVRYRREPGNPREAIAANVTREVLVRLVGDLSAAA